MAISLVAEAAISGRASSRAVGGQGTGGKGDSMSEDIFEEEEQIAQEQASVEARVLRRTIRDLPTLQPPITCECSANEWTACSSSTRTTS